MKFRSLVLMFLLVVVLALVGCGKPSIEGEWFSSESGKTLKVDKEWMTTDDGQVRYTITGDTSLQVTQDGDVMDIMFALDGDTLTLTASGSGNLGGTFLRVGSSAYKDAKAEWDKKQAEEQAKKDAKAEEEKFEDAKSECEGNRSSVVSSFEYYLWAVNQSGKYPEPTKKIQSDFAGLTTIDEFASQMLKLQEPMGVGNPRLTPDEAENAKCPSGGDITFAEWVEDAYIPRFNCSIHGTK